MESFVSMTYQWPRTMLTTTAPSKSAELTEPAKQSGQPAVVLSRHSVASAPRPIPAAATAGIGEPASPLAQPEIPKDSCDCDGTVGEVSLRT